MLRVIYLTIVILIICLFALLFAFWRTFSEFRDISTYNVKTIVEGLKTQKSALSKLDTDIKNLSQRIDKNEKKTEDRFKRFEDNKR